MPDSSTPAPSTLSAVSASALLLDEAELARHARTTLSAADHATIVGASPVRVRVRDRDGEPELRELPEELVATVGRGRRTTVVVAPRLDDGVWLVLDGTLVSRDDAVVLAVDAVWVGCPHGHGHARLVDLDAYATAAPDTLRAAMPRIVEHSNTEHAADLRALAQRRLGLLAGDVAAASLRDLDATGVTLRVVEWQGGHDLRLAFARPATSSCDLLGLLRTVLH